MKSRPKVKSAAPTRSVTQQARTGVQSIAGIAGAVLFLAACSTHDAPSHDSAARTALATDSSKSSAATDSITRISPDSALRPNSIARNASGDSMLTFRGLASLRIGMSRVVAESALGSALVARGNDMWQNCGYVTSDRIPTGVHVIVEAGSIARMDVDSSAHLATADGIRIGDAEQKVQRSYAGGVTSTPAKYTKGRTLTVRSASPADSMLRLVFETDNLRVLQFRAGREPQVEYVERCG
jgi:hypothetical protein